MARAGVAVDLKSWEVPWPSGGSPVVAPALTGTFTLCKYGKQVKYVVPATKEMFSYVTIETQSFPYCTSLWLRLNWCCG